MVSHLKATLLDVVELQAKGLYAAYDSPLVTDQTDPDTPDVAEGEKKIYTVLNESFDESSRPTCSSWQTCNKVVHVILTCNKHIGKTR